MVYSPSINVLPNRQCRSCRFNARSPYLVCAVHPAGPEQRQCPDFESLHSETQNSNAGENHGSPTAQSSFQGVEAEWMSFWGPTDEEWLAFWESEEMTHELSEG